MGKISGWADAVSQTEGQNTIAEAAAEAVQAASEAAAAVQALIDYSSSEEVSPSITDNQFSWDEEDGSSWSVSSSTPTNSVSVCQPVSANLVEEAQLESFADYEQMILDEIEALNPTCIEYEDDSLECDISDFECEAIATLVEYASSREEIDLFPLARALMALKRRCVQPESGIVLPSPNLDSLFSRIKEVLF